MTDQPQSFASFAYRAQMPDRQAISGTIDAANAADAHRRLQALHLQTIELEPAPRPPRAKPLGSDDFLAFNQQLAQLTRAALPVEQGLRLIAQEMRGSAMKRTIDQVAAELEGGKTLPEAIDAHREQFPPLYSRLIDAGVRAGNLPGILLNLSRHLSLVRRMQAMLWQTLTYPLIVIGILFGVVMFIFLALFPRLDDIFRDFHAELPTLTVVILAISRALSDPRLWIAMAAIIVLAILIWIFLRITGRLRTVRETVLLPLPLVGAVLRRNLIARWCDAVALGVEAGMDLPGAIDLASDAIASRIIRADGDVLVGAISAGRTIGSIGGLRIIPPTALSAMDAASGRGDLAPTLRMLSQIYQEQAELRLGSIQGILMPVVLLILGLVVGLVMFAVLLPMISLIEAISGPMH
jgi:type II secretory pathway component PulF